jgi:hypothetical protein
MKSFRRCLACFGCLLFAASAYASQISFTFNFGNLQTGQLILYRGSEGIFTESIYAGKGTATVLDNGLAPTLLGGQTFDTYCVDLLHDIYSGATPQVSLGSMQDWTQPNPPAGAGTPTPGSWPWTTNPYAGEAAAFLYNNFVNDGLGETDKKYREAGLQLALWEVLYEGSSDISSPVAFNLGAGNIAFSNFDSRVTGFGAGYLSGLPAEYQNLSSSNALWLQTANQSEGLGAQTQDMIGPKPVPEPASLLLVGSGVIIVAGATLRRRKNR